MEKMEVLPRGNDPDGAKILASDSAANVPRFFPQDFPNLPRYEQASYGLSQVPCKRRFLHFCSFDRSVFIFHLALI